MTKSIIIYPVTSWIKRIDGIQPRYLQTLYRYRKINAQLTDWAKVNYTSRFTREDFHRPAYLTNALFRDLARQGWPTLPVYDPNGYMFHSPSPALPLRDGGNTTFKQTIYISKYLLFLNR